ncbi:cache domain-containing protein [Pseudaminobacter sp. NGMCC 1.201702]|uniref:cache domain-containing protein n=1 Tax=Pseudaminobacter sp. NGMCC 1.201702 TaxID=3391825 RepID=UPI0039EDEE1A
MNEMIARRPPSLTMAIYTFVTLGGLILAAGAWLTINDRLQEFQQAALAEAVQTRARGVEMTFARALYQEWRDARTIAQQFSQKDPVAIRSSLDLLAADDTRVSWAGIAASDGTVTTASGGLLEGRNVSSRAWFQRGLNGAFAGDVHEAVLLAELLPAIDGEPRRFIDLATPVPGPDGQTVGVLGLHINFAWLQDHLKETARALALDVFLIDRDGNIVVGTDDSVFGHIDLKSIRSAAIGAENAMVERWPDGRSYFTSVIPQVSYEDLPSFGWSFVARISNEAFDLSQASVSNALILLLMGFGLLLAAMTFLFVQVFVVPIRNLSETATAILRGEEVYPLESRSSAEVGMLGAAIARLQTIEMNAHAKRNF